MRTLRTEDPVSVFSVLNGLELPVLAIGPDRRIVSVGRAAASLFGYDGTELEGRDPAVLFPSMSPAALRPGGVDEGICRHETLSRKKDGEEFPSVVSLFRAAGRGEWLVVVQDLADPRKPERRAFHPTKEISLFNAFAEILNHHLDTQQMATKAVERIHEVMGGWAVLFYLRNDDDVLSLSAHAGVKRSAVSRLESFTRGECVVGRVFSSGQAVLVRKVSADPAVTRLNLVLSDVQSVAAAPIVSEGEVLGVICVASQRTDHFTSVDIQTLSTLGAQIGVVLENTRLLGQLRKKMGQIDLIRELSEAIGSSLSIGMVFRIMVSELKKLVGYDRASLLLFDEQRRDLIIFALDTELKTVLGKGLRAPLGDTSAGWVALNNRAWINEDLSKELKFKLDQKLLDEGIRSSVSLPLYQDRMLGVFNLDSRNAGHYHPADLEVLLPVARHIAIALENALLFDAVSKEKREWERTFDAITDMVWIEDLRQKVIRANRTLLQRTGLAGTEVSGKTCGELLARMGIGPTVCVCCDTLVSQKQSFREIRGAGDTLFHFWAYPLMDDDGTPYAIVHYLKEVTATKRMEQELLRSDKLAALGTLIAGIAHEINNPLGIIAGYAEALLNRADSETLRAVSDFEDFPEYLGTIHKEIFRCKEILRSLLEFARPQRATIRELDINELLKEVILLVTHRAKRLHHRLVENLNREVPKIFAEAGSLRQLFMNIIMNAMYYTPEGGEIRIVSEAEENPSGRMVRVTIRDSGAGIPEENLEKVFDPFFTTKPLGEGTGLGLSICHRIVKEHNGRIEVHSAPGEGAAFTVWLPAGKTE